MKHSSMTSKDFSNGFDTQRLSRSTKYNEVREKLDKLKYKFHFDVSNLQLIELLVNDINNLQGDLDKFRKESEALKSQNEKANLNLNAFKQENVKLIKENNELIKQNVEYGKNIYTSNSSKQMEIKRLQEEKNDFKFMLANAKLKLNNLVKENSSLRAKLNTLLSKIYDSNLNENSLRVMFDNDRNLRNIDYLENAEADARKAVFQRSSGSNLNNFNNTDKNNLQSKEEFNKQQQSNSNLRNLNNINDLTDLKVGIYVKQRNLHMNGNLDFSNNSITKINQNKDFLKKVIADTFGKTYMNQDDRQYRDSNTNFNPSLHSNYPTSVANNQGNSNTNNAFDYKKFKENYDKLSNENLMLMNKINTLEKELKDKNKEINRLNYLCRSENSPANEILIKYLKDEKESLIEKYEKRIEFLITENKKLEDTNLNNNQKLKIYKDQYPYVTECEHKINELTKKNKKLLESYNEMESKLKAVIKEKDALNEQIKFHKENCISKNLVVENEKNYKKLYEDYSVNQEVMKKLDEKVRESEANNNSTKSILLCEIKEIKAKLEALSNEKNKLTEEIKSNKADKENLLDKINLLNMNLLKKENDIRDVYEKIEKIQNDFEDVLIEKNSMKSSVESLNEKIYQMKIEINNKDEEIRRLISVKNMLEKGNSLLQKNLV